METKLNANKMDKVRRRCGFFNGIDVLAERSRGGLSLGWNRGQLITLKSLSKNHIDVEIQEDDGKPRWWFTVSIRLRMLEIKRRHGIYLEGWEGKICCLSLLGETLMIFCLHMKSKEGYQG
ncbi:hypothetical protein J1N35_014184 [Gossypium stocksii]|uniref:Uncharacterized protein n=1 Tax=Gossypium stocksii TaxID=47602 RepID=A0A9D4A7D6_9ROSI|nr:hypothetical protein J1N35_014184 [Gossypium stocksii]